MGKTSVHGFRAGIVRLLTASDSLQRAILGVSVDTMLRASDLLSLRVSTVRGDNGMIRGVSLSDNART